MGRTLPERADDAQAVRVVHEEHAVVGMGDVRELSQRGHVPSTEKTPSVTTSAGFRPTTNARAAATSPCGTTTTRARDSRQASTSDA